MPPSGSRCGFPEAAGDASIERRELSAKALAGKCDLPGSSAVVVEDAHLGLCGGACGFKCCSKGAASIEAPSEEKISTSRREGSGISTRLHCLSRWCVLSVYCGYCILTGPGYFNWTAVADVLQSNGTYAWLCTATPREQSRAAHTPLCMEQELAIDRLFSVMSASTFVFSFLAGLCLDLLGPKVAGMTGVASMAAGWTLLASVSKHFDSGVPGAVFVGAGVDMAFFPCLGVASLFAGSASAVIGLLGACRSLSFVVPLVCKVTAVDASLASPKAVLLVYAGGALGLCLFAATLVLPWKKWRSESSSVSTEEENSRGKGGMAGRVEATDETPVQCDTFHQTTSLDCVHLDSFGVLEASSGVAVLRVERETDSGIGKDSSASSSFLSKCKSCLGAAQIINRVGLKLQGKTASLVRECLSIRYLPLLPFFAFTLINVIFFIPSAAHLMPGAYAANQVVQVFSFVPCPLIGMAADKFGVLPVMHFTNSCILLAFSSVLIPSIPAWIGLQYVASVLLAVATSFMMSQLYCYGESTFSHENKGSMIGFVCCFAGVASLVVHPMREYAASHCFEHICYIAIALCAANAVSVAVLQFAKRRDGVTKATDEEKASRSGQTLSQDQLPA